MGFIFGFAWVKSTFSAWISMISGSGSRFWQVWERGQGWLLWMGGMSLLDPQSHPARGVTFMKLSLEQDRGCIHLWFAPLGSMIFPWELKISIKFLDFPWFSNILSCSSTVYMLWDYEIITPWMNICLVVASTCLVPTKKVNKKWSCTWETTEVDLP